jgi:hypothetical protein
VEGGRDVVGGLSGHSCADELERGEGQAVKATQ